MQFPSVKLIVTSSFSTDVLVCECRVSPEQPRSESVITKRFGADARRPVSIGEGGRVMVSMALGRPAGSAIRGAAAASGTTTAIATNQAGSAARADSVSRHRRVSRTSISRVASCAGRAIATLASEVARAARKPRAMSSRCEAYSEGVAPARSTWSSQARSRSSRRRVAASHTIGWNQ